MAKLEIRENTGLEEHAWLCECHGGFLRIMYDADYEYDTLLYIQHHDSPPNWRARIKTAWKVLRGANEPSSEIVFNTAQIESFEQWMKEHKR